MSTINKVELHLANTLEELNKRAIDNPSIEKLKYSTCANITNIIELTWTEAKKAEQNHDEESAYILYIRLYECFKALMKAKDIATNQVKKKR